MNSGFGADIYVVASKLFWFVAAPSSLIVFSIAAGALRIYLTRGRRGTALVFVPALLLALLWVFPAGEWLIYPLEARFPQPALPPKLDGIVVATGAVAIDQSVAWRQVQVDAAAEQLTATAALARRYPDARILVTGGFPFLMGSGQSEASLARAFLLSLGVAPQQMVLETEARNKFEVARNAYRLVHPGPGQVWLLVASGFLMPRALGTFQCQGWTDLIPYPVGYRSAGLVPFRGTFNFVSQLQLLDLAAREWEGLVVYRALGRTCELFPGPKH